METPDQFGKSYNIKKIYKVKDANNNRCPFRTNLIDMYLRYKFYRMKEFGMFDYGFSPPNRYLLENLK